MAEEDASPIATPTTAAVAPGAKATAGPSVVRGHGAGRDRLLGDREVAGRPAIQDIKVAAYIADAGDAA